MQRRLFSQSTNQKLSVALESLAKNWESFQRPLPRNIKSWNAYLAERELEGWVKEGGETDLRMRLLSKLMTYPMTMVNNIYLCADSGKLESTPIHVTVLGARAEATLPFQYWEEVGRFFPEREVHISFIGPQVAPWLDKKTKQSKNGFITAKFYTGLYDEIVAQGQFESQNQNMFLLYNSGIGHAKEGKNWNGVITTLKQEEQASIVLTSFNDDDYENDLEAMGTILRDSPGPRRVAERLGHNPFCSLWEEQLQQVVVGENGEEEKVVQQVITNQFASCVRKSTTP